jgi:hypothetical protein
MAGANRENEVIEYPFLVCFLFASDTRLMVLWGVDFIVADQYKKVATASCDDTD